MPTLRRAGPADAAAVRDLTRAAYAKWVPVIGVEPVPMTVDYDRAVVEHRIDLLVENAALLALVETELRSGDLLIINLAVATGQQSKGYGRHLLGHAEMLAREAGLGAIRLYTNKKMIENIDFYRRNGFAIESEEIVLGRHRVNMVKYGETA